jgi:hypothetical protein
MIYILLVYIGVNTITPVVQQIEFNSYDTCMTAREKVGTQFSGHQYPEVYVICVAK